MAIYLNANELLRSLSPEDINARWLVKIMMESKEHNMTNGDRLRAMSDEELAEWLDDNDSYFPTGNRHWLDWLKQEAENG